MQDRRRGARLMRHGAYCVGINRYRDDREFVAQSLALSGRVEREQMLAVLRCDCEHRIVGQTGALFIGRKRSCFACHHRTACPVEFVGSHPLCKQVNRVMLIQQCGKAPFLRCKQAVGGHRKLIGVDQIKGIAGGQAMHNCLHLLDLVARHYDRQPGEQPLSCSLQVTPGGSLHRRRVNSTADGPYVLDRFGLVFVANEGYQCDLMLLRQMPEHVIRPDFGARVEGVRKDLREEEDACHCGSPPLELQHGRHGPQ